MTMEPLHTGGTPGDTQTPASAPPQPPGPPFPVVGLGASAGGLPALQAFFDHTPPDTGMAFVVILHLSPEHESQAAAVLQRHTAMPVTQVTAPVPLAHNRVYVIPPGKRLLMVDGQLRLEEPPTEQDRRAPIDHFLRTLADTQDSNAAAVILSGTGSDGAEGVKRVKEYNGTVLVQDPQEAAWDGMPRSAIATGLVDYVLPVATMPEVLQAYWRRASQLHLPGEGDGAEDVTSSDDEATLREVLAVLRVRTKHDFSQYKRPTLLRRIGRRMQVMGVSDLATYLDVLRSRPEECQALLQDLLISVTNFFRDREAWTALEAIIPLLFQGKGPGDQVRVWVTACATGEEAYTVAMLLHEHARTLDHPPQVQVFATDIDEDAIRRARHGSYPETIAGDVSPERLQQFFVLEQGRYRVKQELRERVLFAHHNVLRDPPFSKLDLITCRNLLIYLNKEAQEQVLRLFHFSLRPGGYLLLGSSESVDGVPGLFDVVAKGQRLFKQRTNPVLPPPMLPMRTAPRPETGGAGPRPGGSRGALEELHQRLILAEAPPSLIVNGDYDIVHLAPGAGRFLELGAGEPSTNLLRAAHPDLRLQLQTALLQAAPGAHGAGQRSVSRGLRVRFGDTVRLVDLVVQPVQDGDWPGGYLFVRFDDQGTATTPDVPGVAVSEEVVRQLQEELLRTRERLQLTVEAYETAGEEYKAANEELTAINEELRAASEELETSKEELQALNEELQTVNQELKHRVDETTQANNDLQNLIAATQIGTLFLDRELRITRYTPSVQGIFNLIPSDLHRPLTHITHTLQDERLAADAQAVLATLQPIEREVASTAGQWYLVHLRPYRTTDDHIAGVVITFIDITERKRTEAVLAERARLLDLSNDAIIVRDVHNRIIYWNHGATELFGWPREEALGQDLHTFLRTEFEVPLEQLLITLQQHDRMEGEVVQVTRDGRRITAFCRWALDRDAAGRPGAILTTYNDITERKRAELALRESEERFRALVTASSDVLYRMSADWGEMINLKGMDFIADTEEPRRNWLAAYIPQEEQQRLLHAIGEAIRTRSVFELEHRVIRVDGTEGWTFSRAVPLVNGGGEITEWFGAAADITERKRAEAALRASEERLQKALSIETVGVIFFDLHGVIHDANVAFERMSGYRREEFQSGSVRWDELTASEFMAALLHARDELRMRGESTPYEKQYIRPDGSRWWGLFAAKRLSQDEGVEFVLDVTDRKRAEAALRESEERLRLVLESAQDYAIFTVDPAGRVTSWNEGAHRIKGYTTDEILGQPMERFFTREDVAAGKPAHALETALREGRVEDESWRMRKDGSRFWANEVVTPLYAADGTHLGFTTICRDLTERKQAQEEVEWALVAAQEARATAEAAVQTRDQFLSIASHELRTPLTSLMGYAHMLQARLAGEAGADAMTQRQLSAIARQAKRLNELIGHLLDVTRLQRGQFVLEQQAVELGALVAQGVEEFRLTLPEGAPHTITLACPDEPVEVLGDPARLDEVVHNLLTNAVKYSPAGGTVTVRVAVEADEVVLEVTDQGIGIPAEAQARLFEPFYRAGNVSPQSAGFGIGLYVVHEIVKGHGGRIEVESSEGAGSRFRVVLPRHVRSG